MIVRGAETVAERAREEKEQLSSQLFLPGKTQGEGGSPASAVLK